MRDVLRDNCRDDGTYLTSARANRFINQGMHHVANLIASQKPYLMQTSATHTTTGTTGGLIETATLTLRCKQLIRAAVGTTALKKIAFDQVENHLKGTAQSLPTVAEYNNTVAILEPAAAVAVVLWYTFGLTDMTADADTPGVVGGSGTANSIPPEYHPLITDFAAIQALSADGRDPGGWLPLYQQRAQALGIDLAARRRFQS